MSSITAEQLLYCLMNMRRKGYNLSKIPITLGDDEELNGVHQAYFMQIVNLKSKKEEDKYLVEQCDDAMTYYDEKQNKLVHYNGKTFLIS